MCSIKAFYQATSWQEGCYIFGRSLIVFHDMIMRPETGKLCNPQLSTQVYLHLFLYKGVKKKMMEEAECEPKKTAIY